MIAALLAEYPAAAQLPNAAPRSNDLDQPRGYLPAHYALGLRTGPFSSCRACSADVQETLLAAYPLTEWDLVDLIRWSNCTLNPAVEETALARIAVLPTTH